jgi:hypothetical protein
LKKSSLKKEDFFMFCLGISGQKRNGKDSICEIIKPILEKEIGEFKVSSFAEAVKSILCQFFYVENGSMKKVTKEWIEKNKNNENYVPENWNMNVRDALINIGNRFREIDPDVWINIISTNNKNKIITDVRYLNEAIGIRKNPKGLVVRVIRSEYRKTDGSDSEINLIKYDSLLGNHEYEGEVSDKEIPYDFVIQNNGSFNNLEDKVKNKLFPFIMNKWKYFI